MIVVKDPRAARPYLFSEGQNMYNRVVLVCTSIVNVYIPASLDRRPILKYQVLQVPTKFYSLYLQPWGLILISCKEYCKQFEINTARFLLSAVFIVRHFKYRKQKTQPYLQSETLFLSIIFRGLFNIFFKLPDQS